MSQEVLDRREVSIGVEHLRGHRVAKMMAGDPKIGFARIVLHAFLDAADRDGFCRAGAFLLQEDFDPAFLGERRVLMGKAGRLSILRNHQTKN